MMNEQTQNQAQSQAQNIAQFQTQDYEQTMKMGQGTTPGTSGGMIQHHDPNQDSANAQDMLQLIQKQTLEQMQKLVQANSAQVGGAPESGKRKTYKEIANVFLKDKSRYVKRSTIAAYTLMLENHLLPRFGEMTDITEDDVQNFIMDKIEAGLSRKTIKDMLIVLKMSVKYGAKMKWCKSPEWEIRFPTMTSPKGIEVLTIAQQKKLMDYIQEHFTFRNLGVYICLSAGLRIGEVCALTWDDLDIENRVININKAIERICIFEENGERHTELVIGPPKTSNSIRQIPMGPALLKMIKPLEKIVKGSYYVLTNEEKPTEPRTYRIYYKNLMKKLNLPELKFHGLRHTFATRCIESKCDYKTISVLLGHANITTTLNLYVHPNMEQKKYAIDKMFRGIS